MSSLALSFNDVDFSPINKQNEVWLKSSEIAKALGYSRADEVTRIYSKHADEFTENMTQVIEIFETTESVLSKNLKTKVRIFSLRGCHLIAMLSRTKIAKAFRKWVLDILEMQSLSQQPELTSTEERKPIVALVNDWVKASKQKHATCWRILHDQFNIESMKQLPSNKVGEVMVFIQEQIDSRPQLDASQCDDLMLTGEFDDNEYMKMIADLFNKIETVKLKVQLYGKGCHKVNMTAEMKALYKSADDSTRMASCGLAMAQYALQNAVRIKAQFDFVSGRVVLV